MSVMQHFSKRLFELREEHNLSQTQLAKALGISRGSVSYYENGERTPDIEVLDRVSRYFNVSVEYLLGYINTRKEENRAIGSELGLSDTAIEILYDYNFFFDGKRLIPLVNYLLEQEVPPPHSFSVYIPDGTTKEELEHMEKEAELKYGEELRTWEEKRYIPILSAIEEYLNVELSENDVFGIAKDSILKKPDEHSLGFLLKATKQITGDKIADYVYLAEIQNKVKQLKKKYQEEVQPCPEKE